MRARSLAFVFALAACSKSAPQAGPPPSAGDAAPEGEYASAFDASAIATAEDLRRAKDIDEGARASHDVNVRRRVARALARVADADAEAPLLSLLADEDADVVAWAAFGLGASCKGRETTHVAALGARLASLPDREPEGARGAVFARTSLSRALGRCGGQVAERALLVLLKREGASREGAALALADVAAKGRLEDETQTALLDAAMGRAGGAPPLDLALYPFGRTEHVESAFEARVVTLARAALARPSDARIFAVRALGRSGAAGVIELARVLADASFTAAERAEAARALGATIEGRSAIARTLASLLPEEAEARAAALFGPTYGVLATALTALGGEPPKEAEAALTQIAAMATPKTASSSMGRRIADLRCSAAGALSRGAYDGEAIKRCDPDGAEPFERARLTSLVRRTLIAERRAAWLALARSKYPRIQERAIEAISAHPELGDAARIVLTEALSSKQPGVVTTAAEVLQAHPDRGSSVSLRERRAALDPSARAPTTRPERALDPALAKALSAALSLKRAEDLVETRVALLEAAAAVALPGAKEAIDAACVDSNATVRAKAQKILATMVKTAGAPESVDGGADVVSCAMPKASASAAPEIAEPLARPTRVVFELDVGKLAITFEPALAPIATTRFVALARSGFFRGIVVHRVVPGFVVQFGDPTGDGYGGAGKLLRCETSPVPFGPLDVGIALAGRDTGSSQLFVTLARTPHLDGEYTRIGRASGDWSAIAEGDVLRDAKVEEE